MHVALAAAPPPLTGGARTDRRRAARHLEGVLGGGVDGPELTRATPLVTVAAFKLSAAAIEGHKPFFPQAVWRCLLAHSVHFGHPMDPRPTGVCMRRRRTSFKLGCRLVCTLGSEPPPPSRWRSGWIGPTVGLATLGRCPTHKQLAASTAPSGDRHTAWHALRKPVS